MAFYPEKQFIQICLIIFLCLTTILVSGCTEDIDDDIEQTHNNSLGMEFVLIQEGEFYIGSDSTPIVAFDNPVHEVRIPKPFYMASSEVTQEEWSTVMGENPSFFKGSHLPVEQVSWNDVQEFIKKLNERENTNKYRLPSEAEWEYACRAGTTTDFSFTDEASDLDRFGWSDTYGWCAINSNGSTQPVGQKKPNQWGLYDMHGNVWEWTQDNWHSNYEGAPADGSAWEDGNSNIRVGKGGDWSGGPSYCTSVFRGELEADNSNNVLGFRVVRDV